ncbi:MAG: hypothetical protein R6V50_07055 [Thermoplasmatota archaeon]
MKWDDCLDYKVKKVKENPEQAEALLKLAKRRLESINKRRKDEFSQLLIESYYEAIKEIISALLAIHGYKSYSNECLISFIEEFYPSVLDDFEIHFLDSMRKLQSDIQYRGRDVADDYLKRNNTVIGKIIEKLLDVLEKELNL